MYVSAEAKKLELAIAMVNYNPGSGKGELLCDKSQLVSRVAEILKMAANKESVDLGYTKPHN